MNEDDQPLLGPTGQVANELELAKKYKLENAEEMQDMSFWSQLPAAFRLDNEVVSAVVSKSLRHIGDRYDENYYPSDDLGEFEGTEYEPQLLSAKTSEHMTAMKADIARERRDREILNDGSGVMARMAAGFISPFTLIPGGAIVKGAKGASVVKTAGKLGAITGATIAASESVLQATQMSRPIEESVLAVSGGVILGGLLGAGAAKLSKVEFDDLATKVKADVESADIKPLTNFAEDLSAAATFKIKGEDLEFASGAAAKASRASSFLNPFNRLANSEFDKTKEIFLRLAENPLKIKLNRTGQTLGPAVETNIKVTTDKLLGKSNEILIDSYKTLKKAEKSLGRKPMTSKMFREEVGVAMRNGDVGPNEFVTQAAQKMRKEVYDPIKKELIDIGLLPENVESKFAETYLNRVWDKKKLLGFMPEAKQMLREWASGIVEAEDARLALKVSNIRDGVDRRVAELTKRKENALARVSDGKLPKAKLSFFSEQEDSLRSFLKRELDTQTFNGLVSEEGLDNIIDAVDFVLQKPKKPQTLLEFARENGGLLDTGGELRDQGIRFGKGKNKPMHIDDFGQKAYDAGFYKERPDIDQILEDLIDEYKIDTPTYRDVDVSKVEEFNYWQDNVGEYQKFLSENDIDAVGFKKKLQDIALDMRKATRAERKALKSEAELIREGAKRAKSFYGEVIKDLEKSRKSANALAKRIARSYDSQIKKITESGQRKIFATEDKIRALRDTVGDGYSEAIEDVVEQTYETLTGTGVVTIPERITPITKGILKNKTLNIADNVAKPFLVNDIGELANSYVRNAAPEIEFTRAFGDARMVDVFQDLNDEFKVKLDAAPNEKTRIKLERQYKNDVRDLELMRDLLRGTHKFARDPDGFFAQSATVLRDVQFMTKLGGVTISSLPDVFKNVMVNGFEDSFGDLFSRITVPRALRELQIEDLRDMSFGFEVLNATRLSTLADITDPLARGSAATRFTGNVAADFSTMTGINHWNNIMKNWAATTTQLRALRYIDDIVAGKGTAKQKEYIAYLGIRPEQIKVINDQVKKHGMKQGRARTSGISKWDMNPQVEHAARAFRAGIKKEVDTIITTKGMSESPAFANTAAGSLVLQFKGFMFSSHQRTLMRGMQDADANTLLGVLAMISSGTMVAMLKKAERDFGADLRGDDDYYGQPIGDWTWQKMLIEGVDRSGLIAVPLELNNIYEKTGWYGVTQMLGMPPASRFASRNIAGSILGPSFGIIPDVASMTRALHSPLRGEEILESDIDAFRRNIPFQNVIGLRFLFDAAQGTITQGLDIEEN